jgi:hypothetical protein
MITAASGPPAEAQLGLFWAALRIRGGLAQVWSSGSVFPGIARPGFDLSATLILTEATVI